LPPDAFEDLTPDEQHFHEATGNEGASFERTYRRAGFVLWPATRRLVVLNQAGLGTTLPYLEALAARWEVAKASMLSPLWREADELSGHMLRSWPRSSWRTDDDVEAGRMLDLQVRLGNAARIDAFLAELSAEGHYVARDNAATELRVRIVRRNARAHLSACADLLLRCVAAPAGATCDLMQIGAALIDVLPGAPARPKRGDYRGSHSKSKPDVDAGAWLNVFTDGEVLLFDEIDTSLRPLLIKFLIQNFHSEATNPHNAQLVFTTHNTSLLDQRIFRRDQIWFVEKDRDASSKLYPLTDFKPRNDDDLQRWYMRGRYGALPILGES
jgi:AAA domain, putative AbiEii toxin, Type IV TA system